MHSLTQRIFSTFDDLNLLGQSEISSLPEGVKPFLVAYFLERKQTSVLFVVQDNLQAHKLEESLADLEVPVFCLSDFDVLPYEQEGVSLHIRKKRMKFLTALMEKKKGIYLVPLKSYLFCVPPFEEIEEKTLRVSVSQKLSRKHMEAILVRGGYQRFPHVEKPGDFALRGEVADIFPFHLEHPVRIEFFDEEIEKIRFFSETTQTSLKEAELDSLTVYPLYEFSCHESKMGEALRKLSLDYPPALLEEFKKGLKQESFDIHLMPFLYSGHRVSHLFRQSGMDCFLIWEEVETLHSSEKSFNRDVKEMFYGSFNADKIKVSPKDYFTPLDKTGESPLLRFGSLGAGLSLVKEFSPAPYYRGRLELFREHLKDWQDFEILIGCAYEGQRERVKDIFPDLKSVLSGSLEWGFLDHRGKTALILESELFGRKYLTARKKNILLSSSPIESFSDLERGDFVVHLNHGIGRYEGIEKVSALGKYKDYVKLSYADDNTLYVPVEQISLLHKYLGGSESAPRLDSLGGKSWEKRKEKIKAEMEKIAEELAVLYEKRQTLHGFAYPADSRWQYEFEAGFPYEETPDQLSAISAVKKDMESPLPMDRLVCGDVGYGKTEVAMRAAFKAVSSGKQVAVLAPTTLLAEQHTQTFLERFENFAVSIKMLSRLVSAKEEKKILAQLREGQVDVLIGTHKILSEKIVFKDLGLLIIDEEQRFGVKHKERVKQMKSSIDVLTLSATPIPRTLYMGLSSLRDMSLITTPPVSRIPIKTQVMPFADHILVQAVRREMERNGQVFMIHNRVKTIDQFAAYVQRLVPEAKIAVGHAQLHPEDMETLFLDFIHGRYDILISTTIVENGIDIPNANTIIIDRPELLGLSELYQLRGRVGRGDRQAYAYLFYDPARGISGDVQRRLEVIEEHTDLGSGFKIAMKDLEIRGAGHVLGKDQSGFIADVGMELYARMMKKAVESARSEVKEEEVEPLMDLAFSGYIPENYIFEEKERFSIYKLIMRSSSVSEIRGLEKQITDRYGRIPETVKNLLAVSRIKVLCRRLKISELKDDRDFFRLKLMENPNLDPAVLAGLMRTGKAKLLGQQSLFLTKSVAGSEDFLEPLEALLTSLLKKEQKKDDSVSGGK